MLSGIILYIDKTANKDYTYSYQDGNVTVQRDRSGVDLADINPFRYRGYLYDYEFGLYYLQSRYYDPELCRFVNADEPVLVSDGNSITPNLYAYCDNDPVNYIDPFGFSAIALPMQNTADLSGMLDTIIPALSAASVSLIASVKALIPALWNIFIVASLIVIIFAIIAIVTAAANALVKYVQDTIKNMDGSEYENCLGFWVYVLTRPDTKKVFYVGRTKNCKRRYEAHIKNKGEFNMYPVIPCKTERGSKVVEQALISACIVKKVFEMDVERVGTGSNKIRGIAKQFVNDFKSDLGDITSILIGSKESDLLLLMGH